MEKLVYAVLKVWVRISLRLFYRRMTVHGREFSQIKGPFIVTSNHPNTLMDALIVATRLRQRIGFVGNASLFRSPKMAAVLRFLHVIPIYRKEDLLPGETMQNNDSSFQQAYEYLAKGGAFLVFPEGTSIAERKLREIRTGTARIALGYEESRNFQGGLHILPVSLNYSSSTHFRTRLHVNLNAPIRVADYVQAHTDDPRAAVRALTQALSESMADGLVILDDREQERMFQQVVRLYREQLDGPADLRVPSRKGFSQEKNTAEALRELKRKEPEKYETLRDELDAWFGLVDRLGLRQTLLGERAMRWMPGMLLGLTMLLLILGLPFWVLGSISSAIPYYLSGWLPPKVAKDIEYRAPIMMVAGMLFFPLFYGLELLAFWLLAGQSMNGWWTVALGVALPVSGFITLLWNQNWERMQALVRLLWLGGRKGNAGLRLKQRRDELLTQLNQAFQTKLPPTESAIQYPAES